MGLATLGFGTLLVACDSGDSSTTSATIPVVTPSTAPYNYQKMRVDLQVAGTHNLTIKGNIGQCRFAPDGMPATYIVRDASLGQGGQILVYGPTVVPKVGTVPPNVKTLINGSGLLSANTGQGVTMSPDLQRVTLNAKVAGPAVGPGGVINGWATDTITGTIRCL